jgi:site-specific DNA recombinase
MSDPGTTAGILLRLSEEKDTQQATAEAFERFEGACRRLCDRKGWTVAAVFTDGVVSAFKGRRRDGFDQAMQALTDGSIDVLVVSDLDRLLRSWKDAATVDRVLKFNGGRTIVSSDGRDVREDPYYPVHVGIAISESRRISKRVTAQVAQAAAKGRPAPGPRPYGYEPGGMTAREPEAAIIREAVERLLKAEPMGAIVRDLRGRGVTGARGKLFTATSLRNVITNPRVAALRVRDGQELEGTWPAIISREDWRRVRARFEGRSNAARQAKGLKPFRPGRGRGKGRGYPYSGLLVCMPCGGKLAGSSGSYRCQACRRTYIQAEPLEAVMDEAFLIRASSEAFAERLARRLEALQAGDETVAALERDRAELADLEATPERFRHLVDPGGARRVELETRVRAAEARLAAMPELGALVDLPRSEAALRAAWAGWTAEQRHAKLAAVLERIDVAPATRRHVFDPDRLDPRWRF